MDEMRAKADADAAAAIKLVWTHKAKEEALAAGGGRAKHEGKRGAGQQQQVAAADAQRCGGEARASLWRRKREGRGPGSCREGAVQAGGRAGEAACQR